jgi:arylsulfatase A-like enzyme
MACSDSAPESGPSMKGQNVLIVLLDACATDHLPFLGYDKETTPHLNGIARANWSFSDVTAQAPYTIASVASLMTGEAVDLHGVTEAGQVVSEQLPMLAERFQAAGYQTGAFSANAHIQAKFGFGRGFDTFQGFWPKLENGHTVPPEQADAVRRFLAQAANDPRPFFAYVHLLPPHAPYDPPAFERNVFAGEYRGTALDRAGKLDNLMPLSHGARMPADDERAAIEALYDASLLHVDGVVRNFDVALDELDLTDDTLLIVLSDHGEAFGQHGLWQHARTVHEEMVRVPLVMRLPAESTLPKQGASDQPIALIDVVPTLMQWFDLRGALPKSSQSFAPLLTGAERPKRWVPILTRTAGPGEHVGLRVGDYKLIHETRKNGPWTLYNLRNDPTEAAPIKSAASAPSAEAKRAFVELRQLLLDTRERLLAESKATQRVDVDAKTEFQLDTMGY